jgi:hypothetical protein
VVSVPGHEADITYREQPLSLIVDIPQGSTRTMAVLFAAESAGGIEDVYIAGHKLPAVK